jgi:hypothetical protein
LGDGALQFKIDFLKPGRAFPKDTALYRMRKKLRYFNTKAAEHLIMGVGTSVTALVISTSILVFASIFFYMAVYLPREKRLDEQYNEIKKLEITVNSIKSKRDQERAKRDLIKNRIQQLMSIKNVAVSWTDKLKAVNRNLVEGLWLNSLEVGRKIVKQQRAQPETQTRRRGRNSPQQPEQEDISGQTLVTLNGATYAFSDNKPLKVISGFMENLMNDPVWEKQFDLTDWNISASEIKNAPDKDGERDSEEKLEVVTFKLELERKQ